MSSSVLNSFALDPLEMDRMNDQASSVLSSTASEDSIQFIHELIKFGTEAEKVNYLGYLKALRGGILEKHRGRFVFIYRGKILNKSFRKAHDVFDHIPPDFCSFPNEEATLVYVPLHLL